MPDAAATTIDDDVEIVKKKEIPRYISISVNTTDRQIDRKHV